MTTKFSLSPNITITSMYSSSHNTDTSDTVSESSDNATLLSLSREDLTSIGAGPIREDVRVSRKKLEALILRERDIAISGEKGFMDNLMDRTNTFIQWPSRMKIGAKTKKDLYVRIYGHTEQDVNSAKMQILLELGPQRDLRITLKMEISYTDHSHLIGCRGATIRRVMEDTGCHIHFPDSNRMSKDHKSNQVTIAGGSIQAVENARGRVRELSPLIFQFNLPTIQFDHHIAESHQNFIDNLQTTHNVIINIHPPNKLRQTTISIKGCEVDAPKIKDAILKLAEYFSGYNNNNQLNLIVESTMEISPVQHSFVRSVNDSNCHAIMTNTGAKIIFPDLTDPNIQQIKRSRVYIVGELNAVYLARQQLIGCLPLRMIFDLADDHQLDWDYVRNIGSELNVNIKLINRNNRASNASLPPPLPGRSRTIQIIASERNTTSIYEARKRILSLTDAYSVNIPSSYGLRPGTTPTSNNRMPPRMLNIPPLVGPLSPQSLTPTPILTSPLFPPFLASFYSPTCPPISDSPESRSPTYCVVSSCNTNNNNNLTNERDYSIGSSLPPPLPLPVQMVETVEEQSKGGPNKAPGWERSSAEIRQAAMRAMYETKVGGTDRMPNSEWAGYGFSKTHLSLFPQSSISSSSSSLSPGFESLAGDDTTKSTNGIKHHPTLQSQQSNLLDFAAKTDTSKVQDLTSLFVQNSLEKYIDTFLEEEIDLEEFKTLTESDLRSLGVSSFTARKKMLLLIAQLNCCNNNNNNNNNITQKVSPSQWK